MKKIVTIVLLLLLIYNSVGYYILFHIQQLKLQKEFDEYLATGIVSDNDLILFKVPIKEYEKTITKDFNRVEGDYERNGKFYEVVKQQLENDSIYIYCLNNEKQEKLYAELADHVQNHLLDNKPGKEGKSEKAYKNLIKEYLSKKLTLTSSNFVASIPRNMGDFHHLFLNCSSLSISSPPPELV